MAAKKPVTFTAVSYVVDKSGDASVRCREEIVLEQVKPPGGACEFQPVQRTVYLPEAEQEEYDRRMMLHAGEVLSDYPVHSQDRKPMK